MSNWQGELIRFISINALEFFHRGALHRMKEKKNTPIIGKTFFFFLFKLSRETNEMKKKDTSNRISVGSFILSLLFYCFLLLSLSAYAWSVELNKNVLHTMQWLLFAQYMQCICLKFITFSCLLCPHGTSEKQWKLYEIIVNYLYFIADCGSASPFPWLRHLFVCEH